MDPHSLLLFHNPKDSFPCYNSLMNNSTQAMFVRIFLAISILWSVWMMFNVNVIQKDYDILENPDGMPTMDVE